jgi:PEP-CTERM motif-containing protein
MNASQRALFGAFVLWAAQALPAHAAQRDASAFLADASFTVAARSMELAWSVGGGELAFFGADPTFATTVLGGVDLGQRWGGLSLLPNDAIGSGPLFAAADDARFTPVPEPQTGWLMLIGVGVIGLVLCRQG